MGLPPASLVTSVEKIGCTALPSQPLVMKFGSSTPPGLPICMTMVSVRFLAISGFLLRSFAVYEISFSPLISVLFWLVVPLPALEHADSASSAARPAAMATVMRWCRMMIRVPS